LQARALDHLATRTKENVYGDSSLSAGADTFSMGLIGIEPTRPMGRIGIEPISTG
jgi:hypothetical protein